ncbi:IS3 family transposase [Chryseobacterium sp. S90]|uniref:IS3 family transposase n=1 Tax=Chryseobacterium sp. S90 TaxID=3395373 RepID=UPI0039BD31AE
MCKVLGIGSRSYYTWQSSSKETKNSKSKILEDKTKAVYFNKKQRYGSPRITAELLNNGVNISRVTVAKYMKNLGLQSKKGFLYLTTRS